MPPSRVIDPKEGQPVNGTLTRGDGAGVAQDPERNPRER